VLRSVLPLAFRFACCLFALYGYAQSTDETPRAVYEHAVADFEKGHIAESAAGFDRLAKMLPDQAPQFWQRGIALYYAGRYADCRAQFEAHGVVNPNDVENAAWHFFCVARQESPEAARTALLPVGLDPRLPMLEIYQMLRGALPPERVIAAARDQPAAQFYAHLYVGLYLEVTGDEKGARKQISYAADGYSAGDFMHTVAKVHWQLLRKGK
jgi:lipoprotein NlpI